MLFVPQVECTVDVLKALHFLFTPVVNIAHQEACGAIEAYHLELKVKLFADSHLGTLQRVHSLVHKLTTELHSGYGLDQYADKCGSFQNVNEECIASKSWHRVLQISDSTVTMDDKSLLFAKVSSQKNCNIIHLVWILGLEFSFCDYVWSMQGNICKHATKINMICENLQGWPYALTTIAVSEISEISRLVIAAIF
ncbi:hypothetical protein RchiOBHm_Chr7g0185761 [Rosa chinensis]|uniref:SWIM-type domain-containing protein n=1 Tax=Rosa chinensis TaxID=74649 RepID=A0A2P6P3S0_ROSCH|nr:hypothetical protein RchiOBHm_Chr7g0185761 [Rosa chinensis]